MALEFVTVPVVVAFLSGGLAGSIATAWFTNRREKANRLRVFRQGIAEMRAKVGDTKDDDLTAFSLATRSAVLVMCARVHEDIYGGVIHKFDAARDCYCELHKRDTERGIEFVAFLMKHGTHTLAGDEIRPPEPSDTRSRRQKMTDSMTELYECAT